MLKTTVFSVVRNEFPRIRSFLAHTTALFDRVVIVDHLSDDETLEEVYRWQKVYPGVEVYRYINPVFHQYKVMSYLGNREVESESADWVFFMDADEFLPFQSRESFHEALNLNKDSSVIAMNWTNLIPLSYDHNQSLNRKHLVGPQSPIWKIAIKAEDFKSHVPFYIGYGNHEIFAHEKGISFPSTPAGFGMWHIPVHDFDQIVLKSNQGSSSLTKANSKDSHWTRIKRLLELNVDPDSLMNAIAILFYTDGELISELDEQTVSEYGYDQLRAKGYNEMVFDVVHSDIDEISSLGKVEASVAPPQMDVDDEGVIVCDVESLSDSLVPSQASIDVSANAFDSLPSISTCVPYESPEAALVSFMANRSSAMDPLREFHLPFLFSVLCHMKPRRYVELGPDICVSAIAAGQTMRNSRLSNELVAVYSWDCEYHPAQYKDKLRHGFQVLRDHLEGRLESSVKNPEEAEGLFADGSIDLLQININHGYASAEQAYNSWLPKVSKNGCIILNNTVGCHSNFSMANFFAKIRKSANATYDFHNNTGLSLIALGEADYNPMISVIEAMKKNRLDLENYYCEFSSDRFVSLESCCIADYLKTYQKYSRFKFMPTLTRWLKKVGKLPLLYNSIK